MSELRFYTFTNFYLSSIQQGIQPGHVTSELHVKYSKLRGDREEIMLMDWAENHKTHIALNGGANGDIIEKHRQLIDIASRASFPVPFAPFHEDEYSLGGLMTSVGVIVSEELYDAVDERKAAAFLDPLLTFQPGSFFWNKEDVTKVFRPGTPEHDLITMLKSCPLAR